MNATMPPATIGACMTLRPHTIRREQNVETARRLMRQYQVRHLPVVEGARVVGMVSQRDLQLFGGADGDEARLVAVADVMTHDVVSVPPETPLAAVAGQMATTRTGSVLIERDGELVGIFTTTDALRLLAELANGGRDRVAEPRGAPAGRVAGSPAGQRTEADRQTGRPSTRPPLDAA